jgi:heme-degrading monooxygenase HmoA
VQAYYALSEKMEAIARTTPGFISIKGYAAEDGEHVSIHEWETPEQLSVWREHPEHKRTQQLGRGVFYEEYTLYVCDSPRTSHWRRNP